MCAWVSSAALGGDQKTNTQVPVSVVMFLKLGGIITHSLPLQSPEGAEASLKGRT